ncbi:hypothetical protein [Nocardia nepalensis]|uniref:hypothetical protein n=1 Tax=Nocardia nepalensis TaxID=3375448 RepID=UPI003B6782DA
MLELIANGWRCRSCSGNLWWLEEFRADGTRLRWWEGPSGAGAFYQRCRNCGHTWPRYADQDLEPAFEVIETARTEEPIGDEVRRIDNSASSTTLTRRLTISKRWLQKYEIHIERAATASDGIEVTLGPLGKLKSTTESAVKQHYSLTTEAEQTHTEEIVCTIPARTTMEVRLHWKRLWQEGVIRIPGRPGPTVTVPFRVLIGLTFDQENRDL